MPFERLTLEAIEKVRLDPLLVHLCDRKGPTGGDEWPGIPWTACAGTFLIESGLVEMAEVHQLEQAGRRAIPPRFLLAMVQRIYRERHGTDFLYDTGVISNAKSNLYDTHKSWDEIRRWVHKNLWGDGVQDWLRLKSFLTRVAEETATPEAKEFRDALDLTPFAGSLLRLAPSEGLYNYPQRSISTYFDPANFPTLVHWDPVYQQIEASLDPRLKEEIDTYLAANREVVVDDKLQPPPGADKDWRPLGSNALRTVLKNVYEEMDDYIGWANETGITPLRIEFGVTDWHRIQGFCNRMGKDPAFRRLALSEETNWVRDALPPAQTGRVPSFVAVHATLTGGRGDDAYLVLVQRPQPVHYYPLHWEGTMAENYMGPRKVTRDGDLREIAPGDPDLHACLLRGMEEEFGLLESDLSEVALTGFFVEAPFASIVAMFRVHTPLGFAALSYRMSNRQGLTNNAPVPLEANVVAGEPLTVENLIRIILAPAYAARNAGGDFEARRNEAERRNFTVFGNRTGPKGYHPATPARVLQLLLSDRSRFSDAQIVEAFEAEFAALDTEFASTP